MLEVVQAAAVPEEAVRGAVGRPGLVTAEPMRSNASLQSLELLESLALQVPPRAQMPAPTPETARRSPNATAWVMVKPVQTHPLPPARLTGAPRRPRSVLKPRKPPARLKPPPRQVQP